MKIKDFLFYQENYGDIYFLHPYLYEILLDEYKKVENLPINITTSRSQSDSTVQAISNIIKLQFAPLDINSDDESVIYDTAVSYFRNQQNESIFEDGETEVTYELTNYTSHLTPAGLTLFIMLDYSEELIENFKDNFDITDSTTVAFSNDLLNIVCFSIFSLIPFPQYGHNNKPIVCE